MKKSLLLFCLLASNALLCMDTPRVLLTPEVIERAQQKARRYRQYQLLAEIEKSNSRVDTEINAITETIKELIAQGIDINYQYPEDDNKTPLIQAVRYGNPDVIRLILSVPGLNVLFKCEGDWSALFWSMNESSGIALKTLLAQRASLTQKLNLNERAKDGSTPLHVAIARGNLEAVKLLCKEAEVDPNIPSNMSAGTCEAYPLHAAMKAFVETVEMALLIIRQLMDKGALIDCQDNSHHTPLISALYYLDDRIFNQNELKGAKPSACPSCIRSYHNRMPFGSGARVSPTFTCKIYCYHA